MASDRTTEILESDQTNNKDGILTSDYATDYIFRGNTYSVQQIIDIGATATVYYVYDCSLTNYAVTLPPVFTATGGRVEVRIYVGTDYTGVDSLNVVNRNASSTNTPLATLKDQATGTEKGTMTTELLITADKKSGGGDKSDLPFVPNGYKYLIEVQNYDTSAIRFGVKFVWFED